MGPVQGLSKRIQRQEEERRGACGKVSKKVVGDYDLQGMGPKGSLPWFLLGFTLGDWLQRPIGGYLGHAWESLVRVLTWYFARFGLLMLVNCAW